MAVATYVGSFTKATVTGNQDIVITPDLTGAAAGSWAIMFWTSGGTGATGVWTAWALPGIGFTTGAANSYAVGVTTKDNVTPSDVARRMAAKCIVFVDPTTPSTYAEADFVSFPDATHMRINWTTNFTDPTVINYMIITGLTGAKVVTYTQPTVIGTKAITGAGFQPDLMIHTGISSTAPPVNAVDYRFSLGVANAHGQQWANAVFGQDAVAASNTSRFQQTDACYIEVGGSEALSVEANHLSMDSDGATLYFSTVQASADTNIALCLKGVSSKIGAFNSLTATGIQAVASRHGFTVRGLLATSVSGIPSSAPVAGAYWVLGAYDGSNARAAAFGDNDAKNPTEADSTWYNDATFAEPSGAATQTTAMKATVSALTTTDFSVNWSVNSAANAQEWLYLLLGDSGTSTFPVQTNAYVDDTSTATAYFNQKKATLLSTGRMVLMHIAGGSAGGNLHWSDDGVTWTNYSTPIAGFSNGSIATYVDSGGTERLVAAWKQNGTGGGRTDGFLYAMVGTFNAGRTTLTWGSAVNIVNADAVRFYPDLVAHAEGTGGQIHVSYATVTGATNRGDTIGYPIDSSGVIGAQNHSMASTDYGLGVQTYPSIDLDTSTKRLHVAWSAGGTGAGKGVRYRTASYSAGAWTWAAEVEVDNAYFIFGPGDNSIICRWDGSRVVIAGGLRDATVNYNLRAYDSTNFTAFTNRLSTAQTNAANNWQLTVAVDPATGDVYFFGTSWNGTVYVNLGYYKATRSGTSLSLGSLTVLDTFVGTTTSPYVNAWIAGSKVRWVYSQGNGPAYSVKYDQIILPSTLMFQMLI